MTAGRMRCRKKSPLKMGPVPAVETGSQPSWIEKDQDEDGAEREVRERQADERDDAEGAVLPARAVQRGEDSGGHRGDDADEQRGECERQRVWIALQHEVRD